MKPSARNDLRFLPEQPDLDWSNPTNMGNIINSERNEFYPSIAENGNLYFTANNNDSKGKDDIYISIFKEGKYQSTAIKVNYGY